jgi:hypothetical protein
VRETALDKFTKQQNKLYEQTVSAIDERLFALTRFKGLIEDQLAEMDKKSGLMK